MNDTNSMINIIAFSYFSCGLGKTFLMILRATLLDAESIPFFLNSSRSSLLHFFCLFMPRQPTAGSHCVTALTHLSRRIIRRGCSYKIKKINTPYAQFTLMSLVALFTAIKTATSRKAATYNINASVFNTCNIIVATHLVLCCPAVFNCFIYYRCKMYFMLVL